MERLNIEDFLEKHNAISKYSTQSIEDSKLVLVSSMLLPDEYVDIIHTYENNPVSTAKYRSEHLVGGKKTFKQIDSLLDQHEVSKVFAYIHQEEFEHVASHYQQLHYGVFGITDKNN